MRVEELHERLGRFFAAQTDQATPGQRSAVIRWQGTDRFYEKVQEALGGTGDLEAMAVARAIQQLAQSLPEDTELWRGIRSIAKTFSVSLEDIDALAGLEWIADRFTSTTINREKATPEFTEAGSTPAILRVAARAGARAVWVPPLGDPNLACQSELLFVRGIKVRILDVDPASDPADQGGGDVVGRFDDDLYLVDPSDFVPTMVDELLVQAGVEDASAADQAEVIRVWLQAHLPPPMMEYSIRDAGFGELLDERQTSGLTEPRRMP